MIKRDGGKCARNPFLEIILAFLNTTALKIAGRREKPTERSSPRRPLPERSRWIRVVAVNGLALRD